MGGLLLLFKDITGELDLQTRFNALIKTQSSTLDSKKRWRPALHNVDPHEKMAEIVTCAGRQSFLFCCPVVILLFILVLISMMIDNNNTL